MPIAVDQTGIDEALLKDLTDRLNLTLIRLDNNDSVRIEIMICPDNTILKLQKSFFNKDTLTDVLSFPIPDNPAKLLGSIAISDSVAREQARSAGVSYPNEITHLAEHGLLHLMGYHHK